jgi:hypothetical protein
VEGRVEGEGVPSSDCQVSFGEVFKISWLGAKWRYFSCVIFPEKFSLVECPLGRVPALNIGVLGVRHDDRWELRVCAGKGNSRSISIDIDKAKRE